MHPACSRRATGAPAVPAARVAATGRPYPRVLVLTTSSHTFLHAWRYAAPFTQGAAYLIFMCFRIVFATLPCLLYFFFFFLNNPAPPEFSPLPLHDALPIFELTALVVEAVADLVADHRADRAVIDRRVRLGVEHRALQHRRREDDLVLERVVVGIDRLR